MVIFKVGFCLEIAEIGLCNVAKTNKVTAKLKMKIIKYKRGKGKKKVL